MSCVLVTKMGFGLVIGFINHLQLVTTNNYYTVPDLHNLQSLHYNLLSLLSLVFTIRFLATDLNTGITTVSPSQYHCTIAHIKSPHHTWSLHRLTSFSSVLLVPIRCVVRVLLLRLLFTRNWTKTVTAFTSPHLELNYPEYYQSHVI
jgi:hypothetical protein